MIFIFMAVKGHTYKIIIANLSFTRVSILCKFWAETVSLNRLQDDLDAVLRKVSDRFSTHFEGRSFIKTFFISCANELA
jgi:hypothetical protein